MGVEWLDRLRDTLFVQCQPADALIAIKMAERPGAGVVVTTRTVGEVRTFARAAHGLPFLVDAARYSGKNRRHGGEPFDQRWVAVQREVGIPVLTDSGYLAPDDREGLVSVLTRAADLGDAIAMLPLHPWWLAPDGGLDHLVDQVRAVGVPIAVALEHKDDPLGVQRTLRGLLELLGAGVPTLQLRCDVSALGLLCHGALAAAVGTRSALRHLYPVAKGGWRPPAAVSTVVRDCLAFVGVDRIALAVQADPESSLWRHCECSACNGGQLDWISRIGDDGSRQRAAFVHALETLFDLRSGLLRSPDAARRQVSWREHCNHAMARYLELEAASLGWTAPPAINHWFRVPVPTVAPAP